MFGRWRHAQPPRLDGEAWRNRPTPAVNPNRLASEAATDDWAWFPLDVTSDGSLLVACDVEGRRVTGLLDTGAAVSILDPRVLPIGSQAPKQWARVGADWGARTLARTERRSIRLGGETLVSACPILADLAWLTETVGQPVDLIIGQDLLAQRLFRLDFLRRRFALSRSAPCLPSPWRHIPLTRSAEGRLCLEVEIETGAPALATFDLGSSNPIMMSSAFASRRGLFEDRKTSTAATNTVSGPQISRTLTLKTAAFAGFVLKAVPADAFEVWNDPAAPLNLGFPIFRRFDLVIDVAGAGLRVAPNGAPDTPFERDRSGLGLAYTGAALQVVHVAEASPAAFAGWRIGDKITSIDGRPVDEHYFTSGCSAWRNRRPGAEVTLGGTFGIRQLVLNDYF